MRPLKRPRTAENYMHLVRLPAASKSCSNWFSTFGTIEILIGLGPRNALYAILLRLATLPPPSLALSQLHDEDVVVLGAAAVLVGHVVVVLAGGHGNDLRERGTGRVMALCNSRC